jgi:septation ring formation regulator EzrA
VRKSDIDDAKRQAETFSKELDTVTKDPRRNEIPTEIRKHEETIDGLKRIIEEDKEALQQLRRCAEEQNKIDILQTQIAQDVEVLEENLRDNSFLLQKYKLQVPDASTLANEDDRLNAMESLVTAAQDKHEQSQQDLSKSNDELGSIQKQVSEKSALLGHNQRTIASLRDQIILLNAEDRGVKKIERIVSMVRRFEIENLQGTTSVDVNIHPQQLLEHMTNMIGELSVKDDQPESIARTIGKLAGLVSLAFVQLSHNSRLYVGICTHWNVAMLYLYVK